MKKQERLDLSGIYFVIHEAPLELKCALEF
jgi:hypothetical protein